MKLKSMMKWLEKLLKEKQAFQELLPLELKAKGAEKIWGYGQMSIKKAIKETEREIIDLENKPNKTPEDYKRINLLKQQILYVEEYVL